jgi:hypothetical protein
MTWLPKWKRMSVKRDKYATLSQLKADRGYTDWFAWRPVRANLSIGKYFDGFIARRQSGGLAITSELLQVNRELKDKDEAIVRYKNRNFWCRIGLHSRIQAWYGGGYPLTCIKCWRHLL